MPLSPLLSPSPSPADIPPPQPPAPPPLHDYTVAPPSLSAPLLAPAHSSLPSPPQVSSPRPLTPISAPLQPVKSPPLPSSMANAIPPVVISFSPLQPPSSLVLTPPPPPLKFPSPPPTMAPTAPPAYLPSLSPRPSSLKTRWLRPYKIIPSLHKIEHSHMLKGLIVGCVLGGVILLLLFSLLYVIHYQYRRTKNPRRPQVDYSKPHCLAPNGNIVCRYFDYCGVLYAPMLTRKCCLIAGAHVITLLPKPLVSPPPHPAISTSLERHGSRSVKPKAVRVGKQMLHFSCKTFPYEELVAATNGFSEANLLGQGGFGYVHKGVLRTGKQVAVKQLKSGSLQGEREFQAEVETISRIHHKHLVSLVGYCLTGAERLVVYEFVSNNTLEFHLHGTRQPIMEWQTRLRIAIGSAKGLTYLHEDCKFLSDQYHLPSLSH